LRILLPIEVPPSLFVGIESGWYRVAGLLRRKEIAIDIIEAEIRSAQHDALLEAAKLVLSAEPIEAARQLRAKAERTIKAE